MQHETLLKVNAYDFQQQLSDLGAQGQEFCAT